MQEKSDFLKMMRMLYDDYALLTLPVVLSLINQFDWAIYWLSIGVAVQYTIWLGWFQA